MGWEWIEGDPDLPETTEQASSRDVFLYGRLKERLRAINLRDGQPWLDEARIDKAMREHTDVPISHTPKRWYHRETRSS